MGQWICCLDVALHIQIKIHSTILSGNTFFNFVLSCNLFSTFALLQCLVSAFVSIISCRHQTWLWSSKSHPLPLLSSSSCPLALILLLTCTNLLMLCSFPRKWVPSLWAKARSGSGRCWGVHRPLSVNLPFLFLPYPELCIVWVCARLQIWQEKMTLILMGNNRIYVMMFVIHNDGMKRKKKLLIILVK